MTQPSHTEQKMRDLAEKFEKDSRNLEDSSTDLQDLGGPGRLQMAAEFIVPVAKDALNNAVNSTEVAPPPKEDPFS
jgi:hypothetical protein